MTDPLRTDHLPEAGEVPERERDARVEDLLLAGLDHYFAGQHELAISVWTRVLFLDRGHARAKAYIDRARGAIAERQREGDELLQTGAAAFDRGDARAARSLLTSAVERGAHSEEALVLLERLNRFEPTRVRPARSPAPPVTDVLSDATVADRGGSRAAWVATGVLAGLATAGVVAWIGLTRPDWLPVGPAAAAPRVAVADDPLPIPSPSEAWISRARGLYEDGRLRDALGFLDLVGNSDPLKRDADELRAAIQRKLLEAARVRPSPAPDTGTSSRAPQPPPASAASQPSTQTAARPTRQ
jgi:tetratricopeptide (TPR) repeat protein